MITKQADAFEPGVTSGIGNRLTWFTAEVGLEEAACESNTSSHVEGPASN